VPARLARQAAGQSYAEEMLLKTDIGIVGKALRVGVQGPQKISDLSMSIALTV
jgi:hypothetical protein